MFCRKKRPNLKRRMMPATSPSRGAWASMRNSEVIQGGAQTLSFQTFLSGCKHMRQLPWRAVTHSFNAITLFTELLALSSNQKRKRIWVLSSLPLGSDWLHHGNPRAGSVGLLHGPFFAPALCTLLLTDSDKESELGGKALFVAGLDGLWPQGQHHNESNVSVYRFPREMSQKMLALSHVCPSFPFAFFTFCQPDSFIHWINNSESSVWQAAS